MFNLITKTLEIETTNEGEVGVGYSAFLPNQLVGMAESDYLTMRLLLPYSYLFHSKIAHNSAECLEKIMKAFLLVRRVKSIKEIEKYKHNLENLREDCAKVDNFFNNEILENFCKNYSGLKKGNNILRYGFGKNTKTYGVNLNNIIQMTDKFFLGTFMILEDNGFILSNSKIASLFYPTIFQEGLIENINATQINTLKLLIADNNLQLSLFIKFVEEYYIKFNENKID